MMTEVSFLGCLRDNKPSLVESSDEQTTGTVVSLPSHWKYTPSCGGTAVFRPRKSGQNVLDYLLLLVIPIDCHVLSLGACKTLPDRPRVAYGTVPRPSRQTRDWSEAGPGPAVRQLAAPPTWGPDSVSPVHRSGC